MDRLSIPTTAVSRPRWPWFRRRVMAAGTAVLVGVAGWLATWPGIDVTAQSVCPTDGYHYYGRATSGTGTTTGTLVVSNMPANYYAPSGQTTDEAAWLYDPNTYGSHQQYSAIELGWFQGYWPYPGPGFGQNFGYPQGYVTYSNGSTGVLLTGALPASQPLAYRIEGADNTQYGADIDIYNNNTGQVYYYQGITSYYVTYPRTNMSQGEVVQTAGAWMGGNNGGGTTSWGYYEPQGTTTFNAWGSFSMCDNSPYWIISKSSNSWKNGGS
jgi:hypothetical protein